MEQALELPYLEQLHCPEDISFAGKNRETLEMIISDMMDPMMHGSDGIWHYMAKYLSDTMISPTHICFSLHFKHGNNKNHMFLDMRNILRLYGHGPDMGRPKLTRTNWTRSLLQDEPSCPLIDLSDFEFERRKIDLAVPWINPCGGKFLGSGFSDFLITFDTGSHTGYRDLHFIVLLITILRSGRTRVMEFAKHYRRDWHMDIRDMGIVVVEASKNSFTKDHVTAWLVLFCIHAPKHLLT